MTSPSTAIALFGTEEDVPSPRILTAGKLTAEFESGNLRYIRWNGEEVLRAVSFIVRDKDWGTYAPQISDLSVEETDDAFRLSFHAVASDEAQSFEYDAVIEGSSDGQLFFGAKGKTGTGFLTNRTGFVVLHPIDGVAGEPVVIEHASGGTVNGTFPVLIDPVQPMMDLRALTHTTPGGLEVRTLMQGDTYEMEDQRNWTDASYKTYVRPLALPWPYRIESDEALDQAVTVTISGDTKMAEKERTVILTPGEPTGAVPPIGLGLRPEDAEATRAAADKVKELGAHHLVLHYDPRSGHDSSRLSAMLTCAAEVGAAPWLEAVIESTDNAGAEAEIAALGRMVQPLGQPFDTVLVSPAPDLKCTLPGSEWPATPDPAVIYDAARRAFPGARIGGGMFSYFTELNRKRPPVEKLDLVSFTTSPMVHAGDDRSVMETHEAQNAIVASVREISGQTPWAVGPSAIGIRDNPYGESPKDNPGNIRQAMNWNDPRQRGLFGAVWALGYFADFAEGGASAIAIGAPTGAFGAIHAPADYPQPWFDDVGGVFPIYHVLRGLAALKGAAMRPLGLNASGPVIGFAADTAEEPEIWLGNRRPTEVAVLLEGAARCAVLDATNFAEAAGDPEFLDKLGDANGTVHLQPHAVARIKTGA